MMGHHNIDDWEGSLILNAKLKFSGVYVHYTSAKGHRCRLSPLNSATPKPSSTHLVTRNHSSETSPHRACNLEVLRLIKPT